MSHLPTPCRVLERTASLLIQPNYSLKTLFFLIEISKNKNEISRFVSLEAIEQTGFFFIYLNRNLPQSCTFVSTGWTNVCNIAIQDTPRDLPSIHKCSNLSGYPTLTSLASRMVSNTISRTLMRWSDYGQMDQCCTVWGEWGLDMSIYSPGGGGGRGYLG